MSYLDAHLLNVVIFLPLIFAALVAFLPQGEKSQIRTVTLIGMAVALVFALLLYLRFEPTGTEFQFEYRTHWIDLLGISYHVGVDGLAVSLMLLTAFLGPWVVLASWSSIAERVKEFHLALLILQTAMLGTLASMDLVLFYVFWEAMLIPMYFMIGIWGSEERQMAAVKFFLYTLAGSLLMLVAILALYFVSQPQGARSFDYASIYNALISASREVSECVANAAACEHLSPVAMSLKTYGPWLFLAFAVAFAVKVPMFPLHTWLPDAHVQAPVAGSMILAGVMLKMGTFGFWRYALPLFPAASRGFRPLFSALAIVGIIYGALMCLAQRDIKKLIAYSSISHLGYCVLGLFALTIEGATGSAYQMLNHGVSTGALFLLFGMLYERRHTRLMSDYSGLARAVPVFAAVFVIIGFSSIAVPGTNGFIGEFLVLLGTFKSSLPLSFGVLGASGVILGAAYMLWMIQRVFFGPLTQRANQELTDLNLREMAASLPAVALVLVMGVCPQPFLDRLAPSSQKLVARASWGMPGTNTPEAAIRMTVMPLSSEKGETASTRDRTLVPPPVPSPHPDPLPEGEGKSSSLAQRDDLAASATNSGAPPFSAMTAPPVRSVTP